jgi:MaoC like domain
MTQDQVNDFAELTNDHNFVHVDIERAKALTSINYGVEKMRFPAAVAELQIRFYA